ncbi:MAG TPA: endonuclease/exonuclease/phosphatase family protein [Paludibacter sp.]|nr:MAG: Endonuclease/Exonuclease/phosphatase family protein [Bacteroidetes bacterium ADurb.Bin174]HQB28273.1 endonuclease/exonuclease/phosphatase family protein [Paludibacter sp.]
MKLSLFCLLSFLCLGVYAFENENVFRVMCYNVENYFDCVDDPDTNDEEYLLGGIRGWNHTRYVEKQYNIARVVVAVGGWEPPALVGLCEVESQKAMHDLVVWSPLKNLQYRFVHHESPDIRGVDVALLYQPNAFKLLHDEPIRVTFTDAPHSTTRDILYVMGQLLSRDTLHVFVCHFPSRLGGELESESKRVNAARILRYKVDEIFEHDEDAKIIIMGDFNDYPDNKSIYEILQAQEPQAPFSSSTLYNLMYPMHREGKGTHKHEGIWGALDQIIVSGSLLDDSSATYTTPLDTHILEEDFLLEDDGKFFGKKPFRTYVGMKYVGGFSDHLPVYVDFYLKL